MYGTVGICNMYIYVNSVCLLTYENINNFINIFTIPSTKYISFYEYWSIVQIKNDSFYIHIYIFLFFK